MLAPRVRITRSLATRRPIHLPPPVASGRLTRPSSGRRPMSTITPCLWFDGTAEEAANFYASLLPDSRVDSIHRAPGDYPSGKAGDVLTVEFTVMGQPFV